ncbi:MAG: hypothetical protein KJ826_06460 [Proteobacteria bacterium]|nr:hypothetical protein [Pseudomonadota bacterium]
MTWKMWFGRWIKSRGLPSDEDVRRTHAKPQRKSGEEAGVRCEVKNMGSRKDAKALR